jgi:lipid A disaccharide synthetase
MQKAPKRILIVAGEASADRYGARLVERLRCLHGHDALQFYGTGGDEMQKAGVDLCATPCSPTSACSLPVSDL